MFCKARFPSTKSRCFLQYLGFLCFLPLKHALSTFWVMKHGFLEFRPIDRDFLLGETQASEGIKSIILDLKLEAVTQVYYGFLSLYQNSKTRNRRSVVTQAPSLVLIFCADFPVLKFRRHLGASAGRLSSGGGGCKYLTSQ